MRGSRFTVRGVWFVVAGLATVGVAVVASQPDLVWPGLFLALLPVVGLAALVATHPRFDVARTVVPGVAQVGSSVTIEVTVTAVAPLGTGQALALDEPPRAVGAGHRFVVPSARRGRRVVESYTRTPQRRGRWLLQDFRYEFTDVLGLAGRVARASVPTPLVVTPRVLPLPGSRDAAFGRQGETPIPQTAISGPDDVLVRDYQPRDDVRRIHWPSTARTGTLMVRREEQAWDPTAWLVVDNRADAHPAAAGSRPTFEWLLTEAASIGSLLVTDGFEVSCTDAAGTIHTASLHRSPGAVGAFLEHLADADVAEEATLVRAARAVEQAPSGHLVVALLGRLDEETARHLVATHDTRQECRAIVLPPGSAGAHDAHDAGAAVLADHGWVVRTCPVDGDLAACWASMAAIGAFR